MMPSMLIGKEIPNDLFLHMFEILNVQVLEAESQEVDLSNELCVKADEFLAFADIMDNFGYYKKEAAHLYHKYGRVR